MDVLKAATDWARAEVFSSVLFILFGVLFLAASAGFWQFGKTGVSKAYVVPCLVAGVLLIAIGLSVLLPAQARLARYPADYRADAAAFLGTELARVEAILGQYAVAVYKVIPGMVVVCAGIVVFLDGAAWRASAITAVVALGLVMLLDTNANARLEVLRDKLVAAREAH